MNKRNKVILSIVLGIFLVVVGLLFWTNILRVPISIYSTNKATDNESRNSSIVNEELRTFLTYENMSLFNQPGSSSCNPSFNQDASNTNHKYTNVDRGISVDLPYNALWGNDQFVLHPVEEFKNSLFFGPMLVGDACSWVRKYQIHFLPTKNIQDVLDEVEKTLILDSGPEVKTINGNKTVNYLTSSQATGLCSWPTIIVIGKKYNYSFSPICEQDDDMKAFEFLEEVIQSVKLLD